MRLDQLITYFNTSPAVTLFRSQNAAFIVDFLHQQFKAAGRISIPSSELVSALTTYCESIRDLYPQALRDRPDQYLAAWCAGDTRWLHRFLETGRNEAMYQLTPHTEEAFVIIDRAFQRAANFVGTESRLRLIMTMLSDLVSGASSDPQVRLAHLMEKRRSIEQEIEDIQRDGGVKPRYEAGAVRERFATAVAILRELLSDFRAVEDRFKEITHQVQQRHICGDEARGVILEFALDSEDALKQDDQGVSFYEFVRFLLAPEQQERLQELISEVCRLDDLAKHAEGLSTVRRMVPSLLADAEKIMRTNQRLSATLRRLLDATASIDRRRITQVLGDIRRLAMELAGTVASEVVSITVDAGVTIASPVSRTFWQAPANLITIDLQENSVDESRRQKVFQRLAELDPLDWRALRRNIETAVRQLARPVTLGELIAGSSPADDVVELLAYFQIARDDGHLITREQSEEIVVGGRRGERKRLVEVPLVHFLPEPEATHVGS